MWRQGLLKEEYNFGTNQTYKWYNIYYIKRARFWGVDAHMYANAKYINWYKKITAGKT